MVEVPNTAMAGGTNMVMVLVTVTRAKRRAVKLGAEQVDVAFWHLGDITILLTIVRFRGKSGNWLIDLDYL
jgi:hypothetical protein